MALSLRRATVVIPLLMVCCILCVCGGERGRIEDSIEAQVDSLSASPQLTLRSNIRLKRSIVSKYDTLLTRFTQDEQYGTWSIIRDHYRHTLDRDITYLRVVELSAAVERIELDTSVNELDVDDSALFAGTYRTLGAYFNVIRDAEESQTAFMSRFSDDPLADSVKATCLLTAAKRKSLEYAGVNLIAVESMLLAYLGYAACAGIEQVWSAAIKADVDFADYVERLSKTMREGSLSSLERYDKEIQDGLLLFGPSDLSSEDSKRCFALVRDMYLLSKKLIACAESPTGSLFAYRVKVNNTWSEYSDMMASFEIHRERILL